MKGRPLAAALAVVAAVGGGCGSTATNAASSAQRSSPVSPGLVMPAAAEGRSGGLSWRIDPGAWEYGRNDERINAGGSHAVYGLQWAEIRTTDRTRTSDGSPREFSSTTVRSLRRQLGY